MCEWGKTSSVLLFSYLVRKYIAFTPHSPVFSQNPYAVLCRYVHSLFLFFYYFLFFNIFIDYAITVVPFPPHSTPSCPPPPSHIPPYSSCPWVILISSLASTFPTLFLPSPCLFSTYQLCYLFSVPYPPLPLPLPYWQPSLWSPALWFCSCSSCLPSLLLFLF